MLATILATMHTIMSIKVKSIWILEMEIESMKLKNALNSRQILEGQSINSILRRKMMLITAYWCNSLSQKNIWKI